jgi:tetratricopeptide (TPR) repeat protein
MASRSLKTADRAAEAVRAAYLVGIGDADAALSRTRSAAEAYEAALSHAPRLGQAYLGLGRLALQDPASMRHASPSLWLRQSAALLPTSAEASFLLGVALVQEGSLAEATAALRRAVLYAPSHADAHWQLGDVLSLQAEKRAAVESLSRAIRLAPHHIESYSSLARVMGYEVLSEGAARLAVRCYRAALRVAPAHHETLHNLGEYLHMQGETAKAALAFEQAARAAPESGRTMLSLGEALQRLCRIDEARHCYTRAAELLPRSSRAQIHALFPPTWGDVRPARAAGGDAASGGAAGGGAAGGGAAGGAVLTHTRGEFPSFKSLRMHPSGQWHLPAARVLAQHGVLLIPRLVSRALCDEVLGLIEGWPLASEGTSETTRQPFRRRHHALPFLQGPSGRVAMRLLEELQASPLMCTIAMLLCTSLMAMMMSLMAMMASLMVT